MSTANREENVAANPETLDLNTENTIRQMQTRGLIGAHKDTMTMHHYYVNNRAQENRDHEVHKEGCVYMPTDKLYLGMYATCQEAVKEARKSYKRSNGCRYCAIACHTS